MSDYKSCPYCGKSDTVDHIFVFPDQCGCFYCETFADKDVWNSRPIEDKLLSRAEKAEAELAELYDWMKYSGEEIEYVHWVAAGKPKKIEVNK